MNKKITFPELIELVASEAGTSKRVSELFLKELFATVAQTLCDGENVKIKGLGTFKVTRANPRRSVSVNNGETIEIPGHNKLTFTPDKAMADAINQPFAQFETAVIDDDSLTADVLEQAGAEPLLPTPTPENIPEAGDEPDEVPPPFVTPPPAPPAPDEEPATPAEPAEEEHAEATEEAEEPQEAEAPAEEEAVDEDVANNEAETRQWLRRGRWQGFAAGLVLAAIVALIAWCCWPKPQATAAPAQKATAVTAPKPAPDTVAPTTPAKADSSAAAKPAVVYEVYSTKNYPAQMSRKHYGSEVFYGYILVENHLQNTRHIKVGTRLVIPPAEKYGIDAKDPQSVARAQKLNNSLKK